MQYGWVLSVDVTEIQFLNFFEFGSFFSIPIWLHYSLSSLDTLIETLYEKYYHKRNHSLRSSNLTKISYQITWTFYAYIPFISHNVFGGQEFAKSDWDITSISHANITSLNRSSRKLQNISLCWETNFPKIWVNATKPSTPTPLFYIFIFLINLSSYKWT